ncbi:uncharacterized protein LOC106669916 [Cimex lectularius]|uniref:Alpha-carbonic anhydrase domain-containing protein n=1 Tax=Cimex lectularius TaxID=79782 RepID=A0A8I6S320_CIMLE|nr:uncharacterized protein LOC106669916 [Cimex lectularius]XP_014255269.1 uncharacterized protein LOC106669916 [Cimex lectularius]
MELNPQQIIKVGEKDSRFESPIDLSLNITTEAQLPSIQWNNAQEKPRLMKLTNSGESVILSAKWFSPRPFLTKGPFNDCYVFSQVHFHWGKNEQEGSEHKINGASLPMEIHVMFFKSMYLSQEEAMKKLDGVTVLAYLVKIHNEDNAHLKPIIDALDKIKGPFTSQHIDLLSLQEIVPLFTDDYLMYWGNVVNSHKILWLICRQPLTISPEQLSKFRLLMGKDKKLMQQNFRDVKPVNHRMIFHVNIGYDKHNVLYLLPHEKVVTGTTDASSVSGSSRKSAKKKSIKKMSIKKQSIKKQSIKRKSSVKNKKSANTAEMDMRDDPSTALQRWKEIACDTCNTIDVQIQREIEKKDYYNTYTTKLKLLEDILTQKLLESNIDFEDPNFMTGVRQFARDEENLKDDDFLMINKVENLIKSLKTTLSLHREKNPKITSKPLRSSISSPALKIVIPMNNSVPILKEAEIIESTGINVNTKNERTITTQKESEHVDEISKDVKKQVRPVTVEPEVNLKSPNDPAWNKRNQSSQVTNKPKRTMVKEVFEINKQSKPNEQQNKLSSFKGKQIDKKPLWKY